MREEIIMFNELGELEDEDYKDFADIGPIDEPVKVKVKPKETKELSDNFLVGVIMALIVLVIAGGLSGYSYWFIFYT